MLPKVIYQDLGRISYHQAWDYQFQILKQVIDKKLSIKNLETLAPDDFKDTLISEQKSFLIFCEHNHVYTLGKSGSVDHLLLNETQLTEQGIEFFKINRGGDITYHGEGQITGYPIFDMECFFTDVHRYVRALEEVIIRTIAEYGLSGYRIKEYTGVWVEGNTPFPTESGFRSSTVGIVGEPTLMGMAVAEKGLMVVDGIARGKAGHAARNEGVNAIYIALDDIDKIRNYDFEKKSDLLGAVKMSVTQIQAGTQHNVVPDECRFVIDIRTNECYSNKEVYEIIQKEVQSELMPRSFRLNSSKIALDHPLILRGLELGMTYYGSPTLSDQALMSFPTLKIGVGDSARSHTADEFIYIEEIEHGIDTYIQLLQNWEL